MTAEQLKKDTENRLETIFHIRARLDDLAEYKRLCIIASLLHAYDTSWQVESLPSLIGKSNIANNEEKTSAMASHTKKDVATLKRWMIVMGVGYLTQGSSLGESKKFTHLCTILMDKIEQRHGSKLKPMIRQIIGKQSRLTVKNVAETQRQNQPLDSSGASSNLDCEENPFQGRAIPRTAQEGPPAAGRDLPRTPLKTTNKENVQDQKENVDKNDEPFKQPPTKTKSQGVENSKPESNLVVPPRNIIPSGKNELPRTPMAGEKHLTKPKEAGVPCDYEVPTNFGPDDSPKTPEVCEPKLPKRKTSNEGEKFLKNMIPCGKNIIPRTPFNGGAVDKGDEDTTECPKSPKTIVQYDKNITNFIPCGKNIPRTPFLGNEKVFFVEETTELQTVKTSSAEVNIEVVEEEPTRKLSKITTSIGEVHKEVSTEKEEPNTTDNQPFEEKQTSKKSVKAKKTTVRPRSKKTDENADANSERNIEESNKTRVTEAKIDNNAHTSKKKEEKIKQNKKVELLSKPEEELPKRRRSPRLLQTVSSEENVETVEKTATMNNDKTSSPARASSKQQVEATATEESRSGGTTRPQRRLQTSTKTKDAEKDVKLPQIEDKSKTAAPAKRKGKKKAAKAKMDVSFDVIEELVPPLKMAKGKDGGKPSERISDEVYSTPLVKTATKVGMARRQRKTKKSQAQIFSIQDEIFQTPSRKH